eukprot:TRINITY_DN2406_c0_g2_i4.p1 TRINITY_DN2406_c0_g2~~TRINITY_DN2406_c0_g2_i4.p1  ORF type:complete len:373 (+),score=61.41 TRINITY_DN2406_c0_g2_i4:193-1311(+)
MKTLPEERRYQASAVRRMKYALMTGLKESRCPYCWVLKEACFCDEIPEMETCINFVVLYHANEFFRSSSTGKLVCQALGGRLLVYGHHEKELEELITQPNTYILFPDETSVTLDKICEDAEWHTLTPDAKMAKKRERVKEITVIVLDGTWSQARSLFSFIKSANPDIKRVRLDLEKAEIHESMFQALRKQSEAGRVSTFEACMLLLDEVDVGREAMEDLFRRMVSILSFEKHRESPFEEVSAERAAASNAGQLRRHLECTGVTRLEKKGVKKTTDVELETWISFLKDSAIRTLPVPVVRYCCHCELYVTPSRMLEHVRGRMHVQTIAKAHLGRPPGRSRGNAPAGNRERAKLVTQEMADELTKKSTNAMLGI